MVAGDNGHNLYAYALLCIFRKQPKNFVLRGDSWSTQSTNVYDQPIGYNV